MLLRLILLLLTLVFLTSDASASLPQKTLHIIGDSQACGAGWVVSKVNTKAWDNTKVTCVGGTRVQWWYNKIDDVKLTSNDSVLIYLGSNDWGGPPDPGPLLAKIKASGARCTWVGPPKIRGKDGAAPYLKKKIIDDKTCVYLDSRELELQLGDGVHPATLNEHMRWLRAGIATLM